MRQSEDPMLVRIGHQLTQFVDKELNSVLTTSNRHMQFLDTSEVYDSTWTSSFDPSDLRKGKMTVYLILPPDRMRAQMGLLRLWISSLLRAVVRGGLQEKIKVHFVLDEAASLAQMDALDDAVDKYRGFGVRLQLYYQSLGQLKKCWQNGQDQTLLSNTTQVFFGVNDKETSEYVSARLGKQTIIVDSGGESSGRSGQDGAGGSSRSTSSNTNKNWQQVARELLRPEEVVALNERIAVTFTPGVPPFKSYLVRYYEKGYTNAARPYLDFAHAVALLLLAGMVALYMTMVVAPPPLADIVRQLAN
jgi:type IV secretion system protein VirD4